MDHRSTTLVRAESMLFVIANKRCGKGHEIALDYRRGNMVVEPNFIERMLLLRFRRYDKSSHFLSRYALSMMT